MKKTTKKTGNETEILNDSVGIKKPAAGKKSAATAENTPALTELVFILDKSGSMCGMERDTVGGFNSMLKKQKSEAGEAFVTTVLFSNKSERIHDRIPLAQVPELTEKEYFVDGCTALLDAIGSTIEHISSIHRYAREEDVPKRTLFVITTDGMENASRSYSSAKVKKMIEEKERLGWEFIFLAANIDAVETAEGLGIRADRAVKYSVEEETDKMYEAVGNAVSLCRKMGKIEPSWAHPLNSRDGKAAGKRGKKPKA